jgi:hypothetical protein
MLGLSMAAAHGAVVVNLDATAQPTGPLATWPNSGSAVGDFTSVVTVPEVITVDGVKGVSFLGGTAGNAGTFYVGPIAPSSLTGNSSRTIEAWVWDPTVQDEKTVIAWGRRGGGPDGSNSTFGHGNHGTWGAFGGWGFGDMGYINKVFSRWTHIVYTYDSATKTARTYKDGVLDNTKIYPQPLSTFATDNTGAPIPFRVARQADANGGVSGSGVGTNVIAKIRVHDAVLDNAAITAQYDAEKAQFGFVDYDNDGLPTWWENRFGYNPNDSADANADTDSDGATTLQEFQRGTSVTNPDTDGDGVLDGAETGTGVWVGSADRGTNPLNADTDGDKLSDGVESNTGSFVDASNTGTNPLKKDSDNDTWNDPDEIFLGSNPNSASSVPSAPSWANAVTTSAPKYWYRFEETDPTIPAANSGSATAFQGAYGSGITAADLGKPSALPSLGNAIEFTGPAAGSGTQKYVDMAAMVPPEITTPNIPELVNFRPASVDKTTTVEYWFKTTQRGTSGNDSWRSPSIIARESPGDGDMYWGKINSSGEFGFSTSDINDILTQRDMGKNITDGNWHHLVMIKEWHVNQVCVSTMYLDGGPQIPGGAMFSRTTAAGNASYQDPDSVTRYIGFTQNGELGNVQYIGFVDEVAIYDRALSEAEVRLHAQAVRNADTDSDGMPDLYELSKGFDPNNAADGTLDADSDGASNATEYANNTDPQVADMDGDGLLDGVETGTGVWVSENDRGTDPFKADTDGDRIPDGAENNSGLYDSPTATGTNPLLRDTDGDGFTDADEIVLATDPTLASSKPAVPETWEAAITASGPTHWLRFEESSVADTIIDEGSLGIDFFPSFGVGITDTDLGKDSASPALGKAMEFTGPATGAATTKYVNFGQPIPELINPRQDAGGTAIPIEDGKAATVEFWFKTTHRGANGNDTWRSPSILAHESGGDGDMYWGNFNEAGDFVFSTSDLHDAHVTNGYATDGKWHHVVMTKIWYANTSSVSRLYMDGGALAGGKTIEVTTAGGSASGQDNDAALQYLGFTQSGEGGNSQFIGLLDEVAFYNKAFVEGEARLHFLAGGGKLPSASLSYERSGPDLILTWSSGTLESAENIMGPWTPVEDATSSHTVSTAGGTRFFRLVMP